MTRHDWNKYQYINKTFMTCTSKTLQKTEHYKNKFSFFTA